LLSCVHASDASLWPNKRNLRLELYHIVHYIRSQYHSLRDCCARPSCVLLNIQSVLFIYSLSLLAGISLVTSRLAHSPASWILLARLKETMQDPNEALTADSTLQPSEIDRIQTLPVHTLPPNIHQYAQLDFTGVSTLSSMPIDVGGFGNLDLPQSNGVIGTPLISTWPAHRDRPIDSYGQLSDATVVSILGIWNKQHAICYS
jgi:hypothetical protein